MATFTYTVSDGVLSTTATWTIEVRSTGPVVRLESRSFDEPAHGRRRMTVDVTLSEPAAAPVVVTITPMDGSAVNGADFVARPDTLTLRAGQVRATYSFFMLADKVDEPAETFFLQVAAAGAGVAESPVPMSINGTLVNALPVALSGTLVAVRGGTLEIAMDYHDPDGPAPTPDGIVWAEFDDQVLTFLSCGDWTLPYVCTFGVAPGFSGTTIFRYGVTDGIGEAVGTWTIEVR
jgi:hypothetical protein